MGTEGLLLGVSSEGVSLPEVRHVCPVSTEETWVADWACHWVSMSHASHTSKPHPATWILRNKAHMVFPKQGIKQYVMVQLSFFF